MTAAGHTNRSKPLVFVFSIPRNIAFYKYAVMCLIIYVSLKHEQPTKSLIQI